MKKLLVIVLGVMLISMISGCKTDNSKSNQEAVTPIGPAATDIPTQAAQSEEEEVISLQPGLETWGKSKAIAALSKVLTMEAPVQVVATQNADAEDPGQYRLNELDHFMDFNFDQKMAPDQYAIVDLDHDGTPEVIVSLSVDVDSWILLLRFHEGRVYGYPYNLRGFELPKTDGTYLASSGALDEKILELSFDGMEIQEKCLGYSASVNDSVEYHIGDKEVSENEYNEFFNKFNAKEDVKWYLFSSELRAGYTGEKLLCVDFTAITSPTGKELDNYYSDAESGEIKFSHSSRIPKELSDIIIDAMKSGKEEETLGALKTGSELTQEKFISLTGVNLEDTEAILPFQVDVDNDGNQDLIGLHYWGGTGGFSSMELYRNSEDGTYKISSSFSCFYQDYYIIAYEGTNYLLMKDIDYNTKYYSGYTLYLYEDGILADGRSFQFKIEDYEMKLPYENTSYSEINQIKKTLCNKKLAEVFNNNGIIDGTGEVIDKSNSTDYQYSGDIDNDGKSEQYNKSIWYPSNLGTVMRCNYDFKNSRVLDDLCLRLADEVGEGRLYTFWIDKVEDVNVLYLYYGNNLDFTLYAFQLKGGK